MNQIKKFIKRIGAIIVWLFDRYLRLFHILRKSKIADRIAEARIKEANAVKKDYDRKFRKQEEENNRNLKNAKDDYDSALKSRRSYYEEESERAEKKRILDLDAKSREITDLKAEIKKNQKVYEDATHRLNDATMLINSIGVFIEGINKKDTEQYQNFLLLTQKARFISQGFTDSGKLESYAKSTDSDPLLSLEVDSLDK